MSIGALDDDESPRPEILWEYVLGIEQFRQNLDPGCYARIDDEARAQFEIGAAAARIHKFCLWMQVCLKAKGLSFQEATRAMGYLDASTVWRWVNKATFNVEQLSLFERRLGEASWPMPRPGFFHREGYRLAVHYLRYIGLKKRPRRRPYRSPKEFLGRETGEVLHPAYQSLQPTAEVFWVLFYAFADRDVYEARLPGRPREARERPLLDLLARAHARVGAGERRIRTAAEVDGIMTGWGLAWPLAINFLGSYGVA